MKPQRSQNSNCNLASPSRLHYQWLLRLPMPWAGLEQRTFQTVRYTQFHCFTRLYVTKCFLLSKSIMLCKVLKAMYQPQYVNLQCLSTGTEDRGWQPRLATCWHLHCTPKLTAARTCSPQPMSGYTDNLNWHNKGRRRVLVERINGVRQRPLFSHLGFSLDMI